MGNERRETVETAMTKKEFDEQPARAKGYLVYMNGKRPEQPHIRDDYEPAPSDRDEFLAGKRMAMLATTDR